MFEFTEEKLHCLKAFHTVSEIANQPRLWKEAFENYKKEKESIENFFNRIGKEGKKLRVIFTGAGSSEYVGNIALPYLLSQADERFSFESVATTDLVSSPKVYLWDVPTLLVSFARSGNSPESLQAVKLVNQICTNAYHLAITCAQEGELAKSLKGKENAYVALMPADSNDKGFAMTGSCTCMLLSTLLIFDKKHGEDKKALIVEELISMAKEVIARENEIKSVLEADFNRIVYIGSGVFAKMSREAGLKILELTAGRIATCMDSSMGFRHGPKSFIDEKTIVFNFVSSDPYTRAYDVDMINEIHGDKIVKDIVAVSGERLGGSFKEFVFDSYRQAEDAYLSLPYIVFAQIAAVLSSLKVGNAPDTPSASGTVNRVVKGVIIHELD
ncbi:MAG: SIS domain-containing protein [Johnsonella sp.]|nr:SIS domain-containing protein [Johnsonella sp.]